MWQHILSGGQMSLVGPGPIRSVSDVHECFGCWFVSVRIHMNARIQGCPGSTVVTDQCTSLQKFETIIQRWRMLLFTRNKLCTLFK